MECSIQQYKSAKELAYKNALDKLKSIDPSAVVKATKNSALSIENISLTDIKKTVEELNSDAGYVKYYYTLRLADPSNPTGFGFINSMIAVSEFQSIKDALDNSNTPHLPYMDNEIYEHGSTGTGYSYSYFYQGVTYTTRKSAESARRANVMSKLELVGIEVDKQSSDISSVNRVISKSISNLLSNRNGFRSLIGEENANSLLLIRESINSEDTRNVANTYAQLIGMYEQLVSKLYEDYFQIVTDEDVNNFDTFNKLSTINEALLMIDRMFKETASSQLFTEAILGRNSNKINTYIDTVTSNYNNKVIDIGTQEAISMTTNFVKSKNVIDLETRIENKKNEIESAEKNGKDATFLKKSLSKLLDEYERFVPNEKMITEIMLGRAKDVNVWSKLFEAAVHSGDPIIANIKIKIQKAYQEANRNKMGFKNDLQLNFDEFSNERSIDDVYKSYEDFYEEFEYVESYKKDKVDGKPKPITSSARRLKSGRSLDIDKEYLEKSAMINYLSSELRSLDYYYSNNPTQELKDEIEALKNEIEDKRGVFKQFQKANFHSRWDTKTTSSKDILDEKIQMSDGSFKSYNDVYKTKISEHELLESVNGFDPTQDIDISVIENILRSKNEIFESRNSKFHTKGSDGYLLAKQYEKYSNSFGAKAERKFNDEEVIRWNYYLNTVKAKFKDQYPDYAEAMNNYNKWLTVYTRKRVKAEFSSEYIDKKNRLITALLSYNGNDPETIRFKEIYLRIDDTRNELNTILRKYRNPNGDTIYEMMDQDELDRIDQLQNDLYFSENPEQGVTKSLVFEFDEILSQYAIGGSQSMIDPSIDALFVDLKKVQFTPSENGFSEFALYDSVIPGVKEFLESDMGNRGSFTKSLLGALTQAVGLNNATELELAISNWSLDDKHIPIMMNLLAHNKFMPKFKKESKWGEENCIKQYYYDKEGRLQFSMKVKDQFYSKSEYEFESLYESGANKTYDLIPSAVLGFKIFEYEDKSNINEEAVYSELSTDADKVFTDKIGLPKQLSLSQVTFKNVKDQKFFDFYNQKYKEIQQLQHYSQRLGDYLPTMAATNEEKKLRRFEEIKSGAIKEAIKNKITTALLKTDTEDKYGLEFEELPVDAPYKFNNIALPEDKTHSNNLTYILLNYGSNVHDVSSISSEYKRIKAIRNALLQSNGATYHQTKVDGLKRYFVAAKGANTNRLAQLDNIIKSDILYVDELQTTAATFGPIDLGKISSMLMKLSSLKSLGFNIDGDIVNAVGANVQFFINSNPSTFTYENYKNGSTAYRNYIPSFMADWNSHKFGMQSFPSQLMTFFNADLNLSENEEEGNTAGTYMSRLLSSKNIFFSTKRASEHMQNGVFFFSLLDAYKIPGTNKNIKDAFEIKDNNISIKNEYANVSKEIMDIVDEVSRKHRDNIIKWNGNYAGIDKTDLELLWYGKLLVFMKKWVVPLFSNRFHLKRWNSLTNDIEEGYWMTSVRHALQLMKKTLSGFEAIKEEYELIKDSLSPSEKANYIKVLKEIGILVSFFILTSLAGLGEDDDDDNWLQLHMKYVLKKVNNELYGYFPITTTFYKTAWDTPIALVTMNQLMSLGTSAFGAVATMLGFADEKFTHQSDSSVSEPFGFMPIGREGDYKIFTEIYKMTPMMYSIQKLMEPEILHKNLDFMINKK